MKKMLMFTALLGTISACNSKTDEPKVQEKEMVIEQKAPTIELPYTASYSSDFKMGDDALVKVVLDMYRHVEKNEIDSIGKYHADTVIRYNYAQRMLKLPRAEMITMAKQFREQFKEFSETPIAWVALHSNDKNEDWVCTWIKEKVVYKNGKVDSTTYQENWRFKDGKIYMVDSYAKFRQ